MKILDVKITWGLEYANGPWLAVIVDRIPEIDDVQFSSLPMGDGHGRAVTFYHGHNGAFVYFLSHIPRDETGFGGSVYRLRMKDGSTVSIKGPWSGSESLYNSVAIPHCVEVAYRVDDRGGGWGAYITVDAMNEALARCVHPGIQLHAYRGQIEVTLSDEVCKTDESGTFQRTWEKPEGGAGLIYRLRKDDAALLGVVRATRGAGR